MSDVPYVPPPPPPPPADKPQFDFGKPFSFVFDDPNWMGKIVIGGLFYLLLVIGWFPILGYVARLIRNVVAGNPRPLPEWQDIGDYFAEGLRLFGVVLCVVLPVMFVVLCLMIPAGMLGSVENEGLAAIGGMFSAAISCLLVPLWFAMWFLMPAMLLFAVVERRFGAAFELGRIWLFIKQNVGNYLLALVISIIANFISNFGIMLLCIGVVFTAFWSLLITAHAYAQVYRLATQPQS